MTLADLLGNHFLMCQLANADKPSEVEALLKEAFE